MFVSLLFGREKQSRQNEVAFSLLYALNQGDHRSRRMGGFG
jgi:hypothetical protein